MIVNLARSKKSNKFQAVNDMLYWAIEIPNQMIHRDSIDSRNLVSDVVAGFQVSEKLKQSLQFRNESME